jgi:sortase A
MAERRALRVKAYLARTLIVVGTALAAWPVADAVRAAAYERMYIQTLENGATAMASATADKPLAPARGEPIGWLEIPRIGVSGVVVHGDGETALNVGIAHLPETPLPWGAGNSALAAHRDTFFRPLRHVRPADVLRLTTPHGQFEYRVRETFVVDPEDVWVLGPTLAPTLTLITCYPFNYLGSAPQRFIVRAERVDGRPAAEVKPIGVPHRQIE